MCNLRNTRRETTTYWWSCFIWWWVRNFIENNSKIVFWWYFRPNCALLTMMKDQFANYVVQKVRFGFSEWIHSYERRRILRFWFSAGSRYLCKTSFCIGALVMGRIHPISLSTRSNRNSWYSIITLPCLANEQTSSCVYFRFNDSFVYHYYEVFEGKAKDDLGSY